VDPTGAGDTFAACFLLGLACGQTPLDAAAVATCAASLAIESVGPTGLGALSARLAERLAWYRQNVPSPTAQ
jgi:sugar/nucleoside kinase (ribokinase family)